MKGDEQFNGEPLENSADVVIGCVITWLVILGAIWAVFG